MFIAGRRPAVALLGAVLLAGSAEAAAAESPGRAQRKATAAKCRELRGSFAQGVRHFERREWHLAVIKMRASLSGGCETGIKVVVPYGRWVYDYTPGVYLGVSLSKAAGCPDQGACLKPVSWWKQLSDEEARALVECAACSIADGPRNECRLDLDWWHELAATGQTVAQVHDYGADCVGLSDIFVRVFRRRDPHVATCEALVAELNGTLEACRQVHDWSPAGG